MTLSHRTTRFNPVDIGLFLRALVMARQAQLVRRLPVPKIVEVISQRGGGGHGHPIRRVELAATRAVTRWSRWFGGVDTCLTRSLVLGGLLAGRGDVALNIGFRPGEEEPALDGHAWVTIDGRPAGADGSLAKERYTRVLTVPFLRGSGEE
jgi:hypothetical protein